MSAAVAQGNLRGILLMLAGAAVLLLNDAVAKLLTESYSVAQVLSLRQLIALVPVLLVVHFRSGWSSLRVTDWPGQIVRGSAFIATAWLMVSSLAALPLPVVTAIAFASPLFVAALSVPLLAEHVGWRRWSAICVGFAGVLIIVRPGSTAFVWPLLLPVGAALANGLRDIMTRRVARHDSSISILFWSGLMVAATGIPSAAIGDWIWVPPTDWAWFGLVGLLNAGAHFLMIEALRHGEAALVAPFRYSALIWSVIIGFLVWGELPGLWVVAGALLVAGSGVYMIRRETRSR